MTETTPAAKKSLVEILKGMGKEYYLLSAMLFFFFVSWAGCYSLLAVWLQRFFNLTGAQIGFAYGVFSVTALILAPVYGMIQDRLILRRHLLFFVGIMLVLCGPYYIFIIEPLLRTNVIVGSVALGLYMGFAFQAGIGALESYTERFGRVAGFEFGHARMWGTLGWASTVALTGILINVDPHYNFYLSTFGGLIFLIMLVMLNTSEQFSRKMLDQYKSDNQKKTSLGEIINLLKMPAFWAVIVWVLGSSMYGVYDQQFMRYFVSKFTDQAEGAQMYGFLNSTQVFIETICTFLAPFVVNKIGAKNGLIVASTIMFCRIGLSGLVDSTWAIAAVKLLHGPEVPMVMISFFKYITTRFNPAMSATIYLVGLTLISQIVSAVLAPVAGHFYDTWGFGHTYLLMAAFVLVTTIISLFALSNKTLPGTKEANI